MPLLGTSNESPLPNPILHPPQLKHKSILFFLLAGMYPYAKFLTAVYSPTFILVPQPPKKYFRKLIIFTLLFTHSQPTTSPRQQDLE
jgi:hypothetical protein